MKKFAVPVIVMIFFATIGVVLAEVGFRYRTDTQATVEVVSSISEGLNVTPSTYSFTILGGPLLPGDESDQIQILVQNVSNTTLSTLAISAPDIPSGITLAQARSPDPGPVVAGGFWNVSLTVIIDPGIVPSTYSFTVRFDGIP